LRAVALGGKSLERPDGDGLIVVTTPAGGLAGSAANPPADASQRIGPAGNQISLPVIAGRDRPHIAPGIGVDRTGILALDLPPPVGGVGQFNQVTIACPLHKGHVAWPLPLAPRIGHGCPLMEKGSSKWHATRARKPL